jgi:hypothetical protein
MIVNDEVVHACNETFVGYFEILPQHLPGDIYNHKNSVSVAVRCSKPGFSEYEDEPVLK